MFKDCTSLEILKFYGNKLVKSYDALVDPDISYDWLSGVKEKGVFYCKQILNAFDYGKGSSTIPESWTIYANL